VKFFLSREENFCQILGQIISFKTRPILIINKNEKLKGMNMPYLAANKAIGGKIPYPYQEEAVQAIITRLKHEERTHIVMACGTGKTYVSLWVAERLKANRLVVFVPSLALINQLMTEWLSTTSWPIVNCLAICSDESVTRDTDSIVLNPDECDFPVTTDAIEVHQFLKKKKAGVTLVFCTYHSADVLAEGMKGLAPFEFGVFDEAHKTAGRNSFGLALTDNNISIQKRLFMTATPRHYDVHREDKRGDARLVFSMDNEVIYGQRAYTLSFRRAMELGVIVNYKVVISITEAKGKSIQEPEVEEKIVALQKAIKKIPTVSKIITFHRTIEEAYHFSKHIQDNNKVSHFRSLHVSSLIPSQMRKSAMQQFERAKQAIVTNARCLTEGIDAPAVDMVAFLNKKRSKVDIIQAIGRALRKSPQKTYGYVFLPLFVQKQKGESLEKAIERADYQEIWEVLQALSEYDESLSATIQQLRQEQGQTDAISKGLDDYLEIIAHDTIDITLQKKLAKKINILIIEKIGSSWYEMFGRLLKFKEHFNHCNVPQKFQPDPALAVWVNNQKYAYKKQRLSADKIQQLESIGFEWDQINYQWQQMFKKLLQFKVQYHHCNVPQRFQKNLELASWVSNQRQAYKKQQLSSDKIQQLESIGFEWDQINYQWQQMFGQLLKFKEQHNHWNVSNSFQQDPALAVWVNYQRHIYKKQQLSSDKIQQLESIGFEWKPLNNQWQKMFKKLLQFKEQHHNCNVQRPFQEDQALASWVSTQRYAYKKQQLSRDKIQQLESIGFEWERHNNQWQQMVGQLLKFKEQHNHCNVPQRFQQDQALASWVNTQRKAYKKQQLSSDKIQQLESIGFEWERHNNQWQQMVGQLLKFKEQHNHCNVPQRFQQDQALASWVNTQRQAYKKNQLPSVKIKQLESIGFQWILRKRP